MQNEMMNIKTNGTKFLVEMKNDQGEYELFGVLSFREATEVSFTSHHAIRMQKVCELEQTHDSELVGCQQFTASELRAAVNELRGRVKGVMASGEVLDMYDLRNGGYSTTDTRDICENPWPTDCVPLRFNEVIECISAVDKPITEGNLVVFFNDSTEDDAYSINHGIWFKDAKILKVY